MTVALPLPPIVPGEATQFTFVNVDGTLQLKATLPVKPFSAPTETVNELELPRLNVNVCVEPLSWKSGAAGVLVAEELHSVTKRYASIEPKPVARS